MEERIKKLRKSIDLTQKEFAEKIGMKQNTIATYEMGRAKPSDPTISHICKTFNVNESWLRTGEGEMFTPIDKENQLMMWAGRVLADEPDSFRRQFVSMLMVLDDDDWAVLARMAKKLAAANEKQT